METLQRRRFLRALAVTTSTGLCAWACGGESSSTSSSGGADNEVSVPLAQIPVGGVYEDAATAGCSQGGMGIFVGRDAEGVYAYSSVCTHSGGVVEAPDAKGISRCCLHGSEFDTNGDVVKGIVPGQADLPHYKVRIEGSGSSATVIVSVGTSEPDRAARVAVPA
jgi:Rieske Fe-S protein